MKHAQFVFDKNPTSYVLFNGKANHKWFSVELQNYFYSSAKKRYTILTTKQLILFFSARVLVASVVCIYHCVMCVKVYVTRIENDVYQWSEVYFAHFPLYTRLMTVKRLLLEFVWAAWIECNFNFSMQHEWKICAHLRHPTKSHNTIHLFFSEIYTIISLNNYSMDNEQRAMSIVSRL